MALACVGGSAGSVPGLTKLRSWVFWRLRGPHHAWVPCDVLVCGLSCMALRGAALPSVGERFADWNKVLRSDSGELDCNNAAM